jgi:hypothetical protein
MGEGEGGREGGRVGLTFLIVNARDCGTFQYKRQNGISFLLQCLWVASFQQNCNESRKSRRKSRSCKIP